MADESTPVYAGFRPCGCCVAVAVDVPGRAADNAKVVAEWIRDGLIVDRRTVDWVRQGGLTFCEHTPEALAGKCPSTTGDLFEARK